MERGARSPQTLAVLRMYRIALATYLTLTTMASPWLCCCATVRLVSGSPASKFSLTPSFLTVSPGSFGHPTAVLSCQSNEMIVPPEHSAFPWLTAQGILRALHILRC